MSAKKPQQELCKMASATLTVRGIHKTMLDEEDFAD